MLACGLRNIALLGGRFPILLDLRRIILRTRKCCTLAARRIRKRLDLSPRCRLLINLWVVLGLLNFRILDLSLWLSTLPLVVIAALALICLDISLWLTTRGFLWLPQLLTTCWRSVLLARWLLMSSTILPGPSGNNSHRSMAQYTRALHVR